MKILPGTPILGRSMNHLAKETMKALEVRRNTVMAEKRQAKMQTLGANVGEIYGGSVYGAAPSVNGRSHRNSIVDVFPEVSVHVIGKLGYYLFLYSGRKHKPRF